jgi:ABC-type thiamin/hydroxymethylpyrimidine transport system permease subunit
MDPMKPTRVWALVAAAVVTAAVGWGFVQLVDAWAGRLLPVPWLAAAAMWLVAAGVAYWAYTSRPRLQRKPGAKPMPPLVAARTAAMAMAASRIGAVVAGFYAGVAVGMLPSIATPSGTSTFWSASLASLGAVALVVAALWLEHVCRLPIGPPDDLPGPG